MKWLVIICIVSVSVAYAAPSWHEQMNNNYILDARKYQKSGCSLIESFAIPRDDNFVCAAHCITKIGQMKGRCISGICVCGS